MRVFLRKCDAYLYCFWFSTKMGFNLFMRGLFTAFIMLAIITYSCGLALAIFTQFAYVWLITVGNSR